MRKKIVIIVLTILICLFLCGCTKTNIEKSSTNIISNNSSTQSFTNNTNASTNSNFITNLVLTQLLSASILLALFGFLSFYFGKMLTLYEPRKADKFEYQISGLFFLLSHVVLPIFYYYLFFSPFLPKYERLPSNFGLIFTFISIIIFFIIVYYLRDVKRLHLGGHYFWENSNKRSRNKDIIWNLSIIPATIIIIPTMYIFETISYDLSELSDIIIFGSALIIVFSVLTALSILLGFAKVEYHDSRIIYNSNQVLDITGKIIKKNDNIIITSSDGFIHEINANNVVEIISEPRIQDRLNLANIPINFLALTGPLFSIVGVVSIFIAPLLGIVFLLIGLSLIYILLLLW
jgi:hypothetical protein